MAPGVRISGPLKWYAVANGLLQAIQPNLPVSVNRSGVVFGAFADDEPDCGSLVAAVETVFLSDDFPMPLAAPFGNCEPPYEVAEIAVQLQRCAPIGTPGSQDISPKAEVLDDYAQLRLADGYAVLTSVTSQLCQWQENYQIINHLVGAVTPIGPSGAVASVELRVEVCLDRS
jgi:hypothetical protein